MRGGETIDLATAYGAMRNFVDAYWVRGDRLSEDLAILLGDMSGDPAQWADFLSAVDAAKGPSPMLDGVQTL